MTVACRVAVAGAELDLLVLAAEPRGCVGIDIESGALVRARYPTSPDQLSPFDLVRGTIVDPEFPLDASRPESVELAMAPRRSGHLPRRRAERYLQAVHHPANVPILGFTGATVPYWTLAGDRPSVALVVPETSPFAEWSEGTYRIRFGWRGALEELPLGDRWLLARLERGRRLRYPTRVLRHLLGHSPGRLLVALTPPHQGTCYKMVVALLPGP